MLKRLKRRFGNFPKQEWANDYFKSTCQLFCIKGLVWCVNRQPFFTTNDMRFSMKLFKKKNPKSYKGFQVCPLQKDGRQKEAE